jgi:hypothetical protein
VADWTTPDCLVHRLYGLLICKVKLSRYRHAVTKGERKYISYTLLTSALDGVCGGRDAPVPTVQEAGWASRADLDTGYGISPLPLPGIERRLSSL